MLVFVAKRYSPPRRWNHAGKTSAKSPFPGLTEGEVHFTIEPIQVSPSCLYCACSRTQEVSSVIQEVVRCQTQTCSPFRSILEFQGATMIEQKLNAFFGDAESTGFGTGWWSGILSSFFGLLSFGGVLCLHFPQLLSSPELRPHYPMHTMRVLIQFLIVGAILFGVISSILRKKKILALLEILLAIAATALGGSSVQINDTPHGGLAIGLDWFLLDLFLMALIYVPLERLWPQYPEQGTFRDQWTLDVVYFLSTHLPIQILSFLVLFPATQATRFLAVPSLAHLIGQLPWLLQLLLAIVVADFAEWTIHFALHKVPFLWGFYSIPPPYKPPA